MACKSCWQNASKPNQYNRQVFHILITERFCTSNNCLFEENHASWYATPDVLFPRICARLFP